MILLTHRLISRLGQEIAVGFEEVKSRLIVGRCQINQGGVAVGPVNSIAAGVIVKDCSGLMQAKNR